MYKLNYSYTVTMSVIPPFSKIEQLSSKIGTENLYFSDI